jgi:hypothetical protein
MVAFSLLMHILVLINHKRIVLALNGIYMGFELGSVLGRIIIKLISYPL